MKVLVTGRGGSGKSTVNTELQRRGLQSLDTDRVPGLARWEDLETGEKVAVNPSGFIDFSKVDWNWDGKILSSLLERPGELFLCGSAGNQLAFHPLFDKVVVLTVDPETQKKRLQERQSEYGKDPEMQDVIIREQAQFVEDAVKIGAISVDSTQPIIKVVDAVVDIAHEQ